MIPCAMSHGVIATPGSHVCDDLAHRATGVWGPGTTWTCPTGQPPPHDARCHHVNIGMLQPTDLQNNKLTFIAIMFPAVIVFNVAIGGLESDTKRKQEEKAPHHHREPPTGLPWSSASHTLTSTLAILKIHRYFLIKKNKNDTSY